MLLTLLMHVGWFCLLGFVIGLVCCGVAAGGWFVVGYFRCWWFDC